MECHVASSAAAWVKQAAWVGRAVELVVQLVMIMVMTVTTLADAKARFSEIVASAEATHERTTITKNGRPTVVIIAAEDLESLEETLAIMSDPELLREVRDRAGEPAEPISKDDMLARIAARQA
jgi:prevent-host-death family protein